MPANEPVLPSVQDALKDGFGTLDNVVADPIRFKLKLGIGEDAYTSLKLKRTLQDLWDVGGAAGSGAAAASSGAVASTMFASTASGGLLSLVGLGTAAATPVGWVVAAAVATGGAYYGVTRLFGRYAGSRVDVIPKFINTPIDLLGASLFDLMGLLAIKVAAIDGHVDPSELEVIVQHFVADWGFEPAYVEQAIQVIQLASERQRLRDVASTLAIFLNEHPDCNAAAMQLGLMTLLRELIEADGFVDEREEIVIELIDATLRTTREPSLSKVGKTIASWKDKGAAALKTKIFRKP